MVVFSYTVADPRTMMIHTQDALIANLAVMYSRTLYQIAAITVRCFCHFSNLFRTS